jgi:amidophosphoribosyltransferase
VGRTFIQPTDLVRNLGVRIKLNPIREILEGKEVVVVDDSIVRGTTARRIVNMMSENGASGVHLRIASPPVRFPCYYGIDTPTCEELAAAQLDVPSLEKMVGADSLAYMSAEDLVAAIGRPACELCTACFTGDYLQGGDEDGTDL